ncbi:MAG: glycosyltransferase family 2 protein [Firmicutes bacterium]|nr:glycosyltransferase family 2 protein [Bacillota bacterium]
MFKTESQEPSRSPSVCAQDSGDTAVTKPKVAAVIPAYNEEDTIGSILQVLQRCEAIDEVIVVNDGSSDRTAQVAGSLGARVISLYPNRGKGGAMKAGAKSTAADILLFVDADLVGLTEAHCYDLLEPVVSGRTDMTVGIFAGGRAPTTIAQKITPFLSGQRAIRREILENIPQLEDSRYGVEVAISKYVAANGIRVEKVLLKDVSHVMKEEKQGLLPGARNRLKMYWEILKVLGPK